MYAYAIVLLLWLMLIGSFFYDIDLFMIVIGILLFSLVLLLLQFLFSGSNRARPMAQQPQHRLWLKARCSEAVAARGEKPTLGQLDR
jgi:hypothetical protein